MSTDQSFWHEGSIVRLKEPYKPSDLLEQSFYLPDIKGWKGFTYGIIVEILGRERVSLHLYDPCNHLLYLRKGTEPIPLYVDFGREELLPVKDSHVLGYQVLNLNR